MSFAPNLFLSNIKNKDGLAKPNRFEVILPIPEYVGRFVENSVLEKLINLPINLFRDVGEAFTAGLSGEQVDPNSVSSNPSISRYLALQCEAAELPGKSLITAEAKIYGPIFKVPYQTAYNDTTLTFLCTNDFYERKLFEKWTECIMPTDTNNLRYSKGSDTRYLTNIKIIQYDEFIKQIFIVELIDAFPIGIANQQLSWSDDNVHRLAIQFSYQKYRVVYRGSYDLVQAASSIFGAQASRLFDSAGRSIVDAVGRAIL